MNDKNQEKRGEGDRPKTKAEEIQENKEAMEESVNHPPPGASGEDF